MLNSAEYGIASPTELVEEFTAKMMVHGIIVKEINFNESGLDIFSNSIYPKEKIPNTNEEETLINKSNISQIATNSGWVKLGSSK